MNYQAIAPKLAVVTSQFARHGVGRYYHDPLAFMDECVEWRPGEGLTDYQREAIGNIPTERRYSIRGPHGLGKALHIESLIPTPSGVERMGDLRVGSRVLDEQGEPCNVISVSPRWYGDTWRVTFSDGTEVVTHGAHEWHVIDVYDRPRGVQDWRDHWAATKRRETRELADTIRSPGGQLRWRVPTAKPLNLPEASLPIDPYLLGVWLGDGHTDTGRLSLNADDSGELLGRIERSHTIRPTASEHCVDILVSGLQSQLRKLGVLGDKHIPMAYLRASESQRRELLRGLMDTDGFRMNGGVDGIDLTCEQLASDLRSLLHSLGYVVRAREEAAEYTSEGNRISVGRRWRVNFRADECPFSLRRYVDGWEGRGSQASRHTQRTITAVERIEDAETVCITVDSPSHLFLTGEECVPTHNTSISALVVLWFALTRDAERVDWKIITTAGAWRQLDHFLWPEIHKWAKRLRWDVIERKPFSERTELMKLQLTLRHGQAFAVAATNPAYIEGAHADSILYIFDESKSILPETFDAAEGAFSGARDTGLPEAYALAFSTPGAPEGRFYDIHVRKPGLEDWTARHVTLDETVAAGRVSRRWAEQRAEQWGGDSAVYYNRVLGEFHSGSEDGVIPLGWVELAVERWHEWCDTQPDLGLHTQWGIDVAYGGRDLTVIAERQRDVIKSLHKFAVADTTKVKSEALQLKSHARDTFIVDAIGVGAGVFDQLKQDGHNAIGHAGSRKSGHRDRSGTLGFFNLRAAVWWNLRELLDPSYGATIALPPDNDLIGELTAPKWDVSTGNKIKIEEKEQVTKRLGRSTDHADAVGMVCFYGWNGGGDEELPGSRHEFEETEEAEDDREGVFDWSDIE